MQRADNSSRVRPLRLRKARNLVPRKWLLRVCWVIGVCEINNVKFPSSNLPISDAYNAPHEDKCTGHAGIIGDRKSTRLNSSHSSISYAVFCLKKKKKNKHKIKHKQQFIF